MSTRSPVDSREDQKLTLESFKKIKSIRKRTILEKLVLEMIDKYEPDVIYLFGSYSRGSNRKNSTIDILIIAKTNLRLIQRIKSVLKLCRNKLIVNPLFYTPSEFELLKKNNDGFMMTVLDDAKILYQK